MKKLLILVLVIALPIIAYFQYANWKRYNTPSNFGYVISDKIDVHYYDVNLVRQYYENAVEIGRFANEVYANTGADVLFPDNTNTEELNASKYYHGLISSTKYIESILKKSAECKKTGLSNEDVKIVEKEGIDLTHISFYKMKGNYLNMQLGTVGNYVWDLQKALKDKGYELPVDGNFGLETDQQLKLYQSSINTYPSGILDEFTFMKLLVGGN